MKILLIEVNNIACSLTVANESLGAEVEPKHGGHVEWGASLDVLDVGVSPRLNKQLHAEGPVGEVGSIVEGVWPLLLRGFRETLYWSRMLTTTS